MWPLIREQLWYKNHEIPSIFHFCPVIYFLNYHSYANWCIVTLNLLILICTCESTISLILNLLMTFSSLIPLYWYLFQLEMHGTSFLNLILWYFFLVLIFWLTIYWEVFFIFVHRLLFLLAYHFTNSIIWWKIDANYF